MELTTVKEEELQIDEVIEENEASICYDIAAYPSDLTINTIMEMWNNKNIVISEFQRNFVWTIEQSSLLIESFLLGLPVPQIFLYVNDENRSLVIDGQQRILSIVFYLEGYFGIESIQGKRQVFRLKGLNENSPYANQRFKDLDDSLQRKLMYNTILRAINIKQLNPKNENTSIYHIFERLNTGGTPLKPQEIRNCVFLGEFSRILKKLNEDNNWRRIIGKQTFDKYQKDTELILRIFSLSGNIDKYFKPLKEFLNQNMKEEKAGNTQRVQQFIEKFPIATKIIIEKFGSKPFHVRGPLNAAALDSIFCTIINNLERLPEDIQQRYNRLLSDENFKLYTFYSTSDSLIVKQRFQLAHDYLIKV